MAHRSKWRRWRRVAVSAVSAALVSHCGLPHDPENTSELVEETGTIRLGWTQGANPDPHAADALARLESEFGARVERTTGDSETLLTDLADGRIDLVYGRFAGNSPWAREVHFGHALGWRAPPPKHEAVPRFAMRNGENGWIMAVERAVRP